VADAGEGLQILEVGNPSAPVWVGGSDTGGSAQALQIGGPFAFVADGTDGLAIIQLIEQRPVRIQPASGLTLCARPEEVATFSVEAVGPGPFTYRWRKDGVELPDTAHYQGTATPTLRVVQLTEALSGVYDVVVSSSAGRVTSAGATLTVRPLPVITAQPGPAAIRRRPGESVSLSVTATDAFPLSYQWRRNGEALPGRNEPSLTLASLQRGDFGAYDVVVANPDCSVVSAVAEVSALPERVSQWIGNHVEALALEPDGGVLVAGRSPLLSLAQAKPTCIARLDRDGVPEPDVALDLDGFWSSLARDTGGGLWVGGDGSRGALIPLLIRLDPNGTAGPALPVEENRNGFHGVRCLAWQADGKLLVGGGFSTLGGRPRSNLARLGADGSVDEGFDVPVSGFLVQALAVQPDGRILVGGGFWRLAGQRCYGLGRLMPDGTFDPSFLIETTERYNQSVDCLAVQPDGKILLGGTFTSWNGVARTNLLRLQADGQLDPDFKPVVTGHLEYRWEGVTRLALQADGKILVSGQFLTVNGLPRNHLARLYPDGALDLTFAPNPDDHLRALALEADGNVLVGGRYFTIAGQPVSSLARLINPDLAVNALSFTASAVTWLRGGSAPEVWRTTFESSADGVNWTLLGAGTRVAGGWQLTGQSLAGVSRVRARGFVSNSGRSAYFVESFAGAPTAPDPPRLTFPEPGEPLAFAARFEGTGPFTFQWFKGGQPLTDGGNVDGATAATLTIRDPTTADVGEYSVEVGNAQGKMLAPVATVGFGPPRILRQSASLAVRTGESADFSVAVEGTPPLTYRWRKNGTEIVGATEPSFSIPTTVLQDAGHYDVQVENSYGTVVSALAELIVRLPAFGALAFTQAALEANEDSGTVGLSATRAGGSDGAVSVDYRLAAGGTATEGQDFTFTAGTLSWADGETGTKSLTLSILDDSAAEDAETIHLELTNPGGGASLGTPALATVTITDNDAPLTHALSLIPSPVDAGTIQADPLPGTDGRYVQGTTVTLTATAAPGAVFLRWEGALTGHDPVGTFTVTEDLAVRAVFSRPFGGVARLVPGLIQAEDFDEGGEGIGYHDSDAVNSDVATYRQGGVDVGLNTPGYAVGWSNKGEWLTYTINVATAGRYRPVLRVASAVSGGAARLDFDGGASVGISAPATGGWRTWVEVSGAAVHLEAGLQVIRFSYEAAAFDLDWIRLEDATLSPLGAASLADSGEVGVRFQRALEVASATRAANYAIPGAVVTGATLAPDGSGVLLKTTGLAGSVFTVRVSGVRDTLGNQVADGAEVVGQVLAQRRQDVGTAGDPAVAGITISSRAGEFDVRAGGTDMWNNQDGFHFIHQQITGDFDVRVRVESLDPVNRWTKAGLMARESLAADSRNLAVAVEPPAVPTRDGEFGGVGADTYAVQGRMTRGGATTVAWTRDGAVLTGPPYPNAWLRLQRQGSVFRAYRGSDGAQWTLIGETTQSLPATLYVGLGTSSHNNAPGYTTLARYREYQRAGLVAPRITSEPADVAIEAGEDARFEVTATGSGPLQYQWQFDGANLAGASNPILTLDDVTLADAGAHRVVVWNDAGLQVSREAGLSVRRPSLPVLNLGIEGGQLVLVIEGMVGGGGQLLFSTDLAQWTVVAAVPAGPGPARIVMSPPDPRGGFFQVQVAP